MTLEPPTDRLTTPRLLLRRATAELVRAELDERPRLDSLLGARVPAEWPPEIMADVVPTFLQRLEDEPALAEGWLAWYIIACDDQGRGPTLIGNCGFKGPPGSDGVVEISYSLLPEYQKRGYAAEAVRAMLAWVFGHAEVSCVVATTEVGLEPSIRLLDRLGFQYVGRGYEHGSIRFALTRPRFEAQRPSERGVTNRRDAETPREEEID